MMAPRGIKTRRRSGGSAGHRTSALLRGNGGASGAAQPRRGLGAPRFFWRRSSSINRWNRQQHQETSPDNRYALSSWTRHHCTSSSHRIASRANVCLSCTRALPGTPSRSALPKTTAQASCPPPRVTASISGLGVARGSVASAIRFLIGQSVGLCTTLRWALATWVVVTKRKRASQSLARTRT